MPFQEGEDGCRDKGELFPVARGGATASGGAAGGGVEEDEVGVDLGLGDLEATLGGGGGEAGGGDDDDLEAMIEAARIEADALGLDKGDYDDESEEDIDLT